MKNKEQEALKAAMEAIDRIIDGLEKILKTLQEGKEQKHD